MARNNISLSVSPKNPPRGYTGPWKVRWREEVIEDGKRDRNERSQVVRDLGAKDVLVAKLRRTLETGAVYEAEARVVVTPANLEQVAVAWLEWQKSRGKKEGTRKNYKAHIVRIMDTIRKVRGIKADARIPASVLDHNLFSDLLAAWAASDATATRTKSRKGACQPMRGYDLACRLRTIWSYAASLPATYAGVPALVDRSLLVPPVPGRPGAPESPTWAECDAVIRRAYAMSTVLGDALAGERLTGLRVEQMCAIRRRAIDPVRCTLQVEIGKGEAETREKRTMPIPRSLVDTWQARIAACAGPDAFLFPAGTATGYLDPDTTVISRLWKEAESAGDVRPNILKPLGRRKGRPNHAFRAAYMAGLQGLTVEVDGAPVQRVSDRVIDYLVGHHPPDTRGRHYTRPNAAALTAAVGLVPPIDLGTAAADNVIPLR